MKLKGLADLDRLKAEGLASLYPERMKIVLSAATCGVAAGAGEVADTFRRMVDELKLDATVEETGCIGFCQKEPLVLIYRPGRAKLVFDSMTAKKAEALARELAEGRPNYGAALGRIGHETALISGEDTVFSGNGAEADEADVPDFDQIPFYRKQRKIALRNCGYINPYDIREYIARDGYYTLCKTLTESSPDAVIKEIGKSGLRGRGGAGFPAGRKWQLCREAPGERHYIICNADEGDPGAYMDRSLLEGDPHTVIEGMIIGGYAIGADEGYIYVRNEYPQAIKKTTQALEQARELGLLGENILGTGFSFDIKINRGGGAFVCGEETALILSLQGQPGRPYQRPPYPAESGLWGKPTLINNVETWANVPVILSKGAEWFASVGTQNSKGTKVFSLVGHIENMGLIEVPMGISIREILYDVGGGVPKGHRFKAVQTGGPSGGTILVDERGATIRAGEPAEAIARVDVLPESLLDLPIDYEGLTEAGSIMGSGGLIVMDETSCMVDVARYFLYFLTEESCGKCMPCREGIRQMLAILDRITEGKGKHGDIELVEELGNVVMDTSLCALGGTAPNPLLSTIRYFRDEYEAHIYDKKCPAGVCRALLSFTIDAAACTGCGICARECPVEAIFTRAPKSGESAPKLREGRELHDIDQDKCTNCGACFDACKFDAVHKE